MMYDNSAYDKLKLSTVKYTDPNTGDKEEVQMAHSQVSIFKKQLKAAHTSVKAYIKAGCDPSALGPWSPGMTYPQCTPQITGLPGAGGINTNQSTNLPAICGSGCASVFGWINPLLSVMAQQRRYAISMDGENQLIVGSTNPLTLAYSTTGDLLQACALAVAGQAAKVNGQAMPATTFFSGPTTLNLPLTTPTPVFGLRVRLSNSIQNFKFGAYTFNFVTAASTAPVVMATITALVRRVPLEFVFLSINNASGLATVVATADPGIQMVPANNQAVVPTAGVADVLYIETLNQHDLGSSTQVNISASVSDENGD
jgi:hypothetical protein